MILKLHITELNEELKQKLDIKELLRPVAHDLLAMMAGRIHEEGKAADGNNIGTYNNRYLKYRQKVHKRTADKNIIVSLTRKLENDWAVMATENGWGIGFKNIHNAQKMRWVEEKKGKSIAAPTEGETQYAIDMLNELVDEKINE